MEYKEDTIGVEATGGTSNSPVPTKNTDDYIPQDISLRKVELVRLTDDSGASNTITIENYDPTDGVDEKVSLTISSDSTKSIDLGTVLEIPSKDSDGNEHQLTYSSTGAFHGVIRIKDVG